MLADHLRSDEVVIANELTRSALALTSGLDPERRAEIATYAIGQLIGVTMALGSAPRRELDAHRLDARTSGQFAQIKARAQIHAMADIVGGKDVGQVILGWADAHLTELGRPVPSPLLVEG